MEEAKLEKQIAELEAELLKIKLELLKRQALSSGAGGGSSKEHRHMIWIESDAGEDFGGRRHNTDGCTTW